MPDPKNPTRADDQQLLQIVLGSNSQMPTGTYVRPELRDPAALARRLAAAAVRNPQRRPNTDLAWRSVQQQYPFVAANVTGVEENPMWLPPRALAGVPKGPLPLSPNPFQWDLNRVAQNPPIYVSPRLERLSVLEIADVLAHELAHVGQAQNFPTFQSLRDAARQEAGRSYRERTSEQQAFAVSDARKRLRGDVNLPREK
jgi:hypothetical protein